MHCVTLTPLYHRDEWALPLERELMSYLDETLFIPLRATLSEARLNEDNALRVALVAGSVIFVDGEFRGSFNAAISGELRRLGAAKTAGGFTFAQGAMPVALRALVADIKIRNADLHRQVLDTLKLIAEFLLVAVTGIHVANTVDTAVADLQTQFRRSVSGVDGFKFEAPALPEQFVSELRDQIAVETDHSIRNFTLDETNELRSLVAENARLGGRSDRLVELVESRYGVAKRKARIIAEAETSFVVSRFRKERYLAAGLTRYLWETSHDERVRPTHGESNNHRDLDGRVFSWDSPPVVDSATGRRRHPGEDYGPCRCVARPVLTR